jgi:hypothetical protein
MKTKLTKRMNLHDDIVGADDMTSNNPVLMFVCETGVRPQVARFFNAGNDVPDVVYIHRHMLFA